MEPNTIVSNCVKQGVRGKLFLSMCCKIEFTVPSCLEWYSPNMLPIIYGSLSGIPCYNLTNLSPPLAQIERTCHIRHIGHASNSGLTSTHTKIWRSINPCCFHEFCSLYQSQYLWFLGKSPHMPSSPLWPFIEQTIYNFCHIYVVSSILRHCPNRNIYLIRYLL
jgi:hypothetical protein